MREKTWTLPPLILHPFSDPSGPNKLVASSRASLTLQGLLPSDGDTRGQLEAQLLDGRYCELCMLYYIGRDLTRWVEQCAEVLDRNPELKQLGIRALSFARMLVESPPDGVREKLRQWGVVDHSAIFRRALGLNIIFSSLPERGTLSSAFLTNYYVYADQLFAASLQMSQHIPISSEQFPFQIYASGEYTRMLEEQWDLAE